MKFLLYCLLSVQCIAEKSDINLNSQSFVDALVYSLWECPGSSLCPCYFIFVFIFIFFILKILFIHERHRERGAETQVEREAGSMQGARRVT